LELNDPFFRFSSDSFSRQQAFEGWRETFSKKVLNLDIFCDNDAEFEASIRVLAQREMIVGEQSVTACSTVRQPAHAMDGRNDLVLFQPLAGHLTCRQRGRENLLDQGTLGVAFTDEAGFLTHHPQAHLNTYRWMIVPLNRLADRVRNLDDLRGTKLAGHDSKVGLVTAYSDFIHAHASQAGPDGVTAMMMHLTDLIVLALGPRADERERIANGGLRSARFLMLIGELSRRYADPKLNAVKLGMLVGLSSRTIQDIFEARQTTMTDELLRIRLDEVRARLQDRTFSGQAISEIALACGFSDVSHFNRSFKARFGMTPKDVRWAGRSVS
jgi:AraC-like DNA-binding protein